MRYGEFDSNSLMSITNRPELTFVRGEGSWLFDDKGKAYLDFVQGWAVNCLGHCPPEIRDALTAQAGQLINPSPAFYNGPAIELASLLTTHSAFDRVFFANTGAEANEGAIKLARKWGKVHKGGAFEIITFEHSFHGRTLATMSASGKPGWDTLFAPQVPGFPKARLNDIDSVKALIGPKTVAIMLEPVQGEGGVIPAEPDFLQALRALTHEQGLLLIVDEVQTGMGRTGRLFAYQHAGIDPDIMTLGKGIGGGVPLAALLAREEVCCFEPGDQGGTYNGNPLMTAVGVAVLRRLLSPGFLDGVEENGRYLAVALERLVIQHKLVGERGTGLLRALILDSDRGPALVKAALEHTPTGLLLNAPRPNLLRFMPSLTVSKAEIDQMVSLLDTLLHATRGT
ncbi:MULTISPECIES: acetylornithine transaminase [Zoogloea]|jgi:acetylornithine/N-succinyldiaminopimelate aminotransferase|uniref:acetylornithine transaminase n=1 Tax=Zoogloea TaxID=349 RepID=UPI001B7B92A9|nr:MULTISPECIES: acetylornithine transaminase [Zoogloea]MBP8133789.1 acetylornithine transaminase [Zoogloea sp.]MDD2667287.1 acetylornithine transaminase [Zoogloea sp.]MDY0035592.1 acetylornithine transaminase [Zoogloea oleivorans]